MGAEPPTGQVPWWTLRPVGWGGDRHRHRIHNSDGSFGRNSFIDRYIFLDGDLVEVGHVISAMQEAGFEVRHVESLREHYGLTLRSWVGNLRQNWDAAVAAVASAGPGCGSSTWPSRRGPSRPATPASTRCWR